MSKKVRRQPIGVALFPFLAVLICTMGALIVLLVLLVQQARLDAHEVVKDQKQQRAAADPLAKERKAAQEQIEDETWRRGILEGQRAQQLEALASARLKVEHLEDHIRRLQDQARTLIARATEIDEGRTSTSPDLTAEQAELARIQADIAKKKADLEQKKKELAAKDKSYALIPYDGPNGTKRRPIYIECTARGVIVQPEGVVLGPEDFSGPLNPGNPLDAALRAIREVWKRSGQPGECYPLLVVRPDGIVAYQAARQALRGWDDEFGYELVDGEKKLDFGGANPAMQQQLIEIVGVARQRQVMLAAAMPRKFQADDELTSFAAEDQPSYQTAIAAARGAGGVANGNGEFIGGRGTGPGGSRYPVGGNSPGVSGPAGTSQPIGGYLAGGIQATRAGQGGGTGTAGGNGGQRTAAGTNQSSTGNAGYAAAGSGQQGSGQPGTGQPSSGQSGARQAGSGGPGGSATPNYQTASAGSGAQQGSAAGGQQGGGTSSSGSPSGTPTMSVDMQPSSAQAATPKRSLRAGNNWGLPGAQGHTTAVTRPVRVVCLPDRLIVVPERGDDRPASIIGISPDLQPAEADAFVAAVQKHLNGWGPAMTNGYWKPVLQVEVTRAAEPQFESLQQLLRGSGFDIQRKTQ
jgi:hypothetical protein